MESDSNHTVLANGPPELLPADATINVAKDNDIVLRITAGDDAVFVYVNGLERGRAALPNFGDGITISLRKNGFAGLNNVNIKVYNNPGYLGKNKYGITYKVSVTDLAGKPLPWDPLYDIDFSYDSTQGGVLYDVTLPFNML